MPERYRRRLGAAVPAGTGPRCRPRPPIGDARHPEVPCGARPSGCTQRLMSTVLEASPDGSSPAPTTGPPRRHPFIALVVLLAIVGGLVALVAASRSPSQRIRQLMDRQLKLAM